MHLRLIQFTLILVITLFAAISWKQCATLPERAAEPCFYFWKTTMAFDAKTWALFKSLSGQQPLYLRVFDVDYSAGYDNAIPLGDFNPGGSVSDGRQVIPTVYITNRVFEHLNDSLMLKLAGKIQRRIDNHMDSWKGEVAWYVMPFTDNDGEDVSKRRDSLGNDWLLRCNEIQIDCDWTSATRDRYFQFLRAMQAAVAPRKLSCTVRLHQYRDRAKAGIPPVDRGMLMCYNTENPKESAVSNAIFDAALVKGYLKAPRYPLPLDVALPVFSWGAWFRDEKFKGLLAGWDQTNASVSGLYQAEGNYRYRVLQDTVLGQDYLRAGDLLRLDHADEADLVEIAGLLAKKVRRPDSRLVFFDWQTEKIIRYEKVIQTCAARFQ